MPIQATCPGCHSTLTVPDTLAGKVCRCGRCRTVVPVPQAPPPDVVPVAEAPEAPANGRQPTAAHVTGGNPAARQPAASAWAAQGPELRRSAPPGPRREPREDPGSTTWIFVLAGIALLLLLAVGVVGVFLLYRS